MQHGQYEDELSIVAYHEAGHAIMAIACGFHLVSFSIQGSADSKGFVEYLAPKPTTTEVAKKQALVSASGLAADMLLATRTGRPRPDETFFGHFGDQKNFHRSISESDSSAYFENYLTVAMMSFRKNWNHVEAFAETLKTLKTFNAGSIDIDRFPKLPLNWPTLIELAKENRLKARPLGAEA